MNYAEISKLYTEKVAEFIKKGFVFHLQSMRGMECGSCSDRLSSYSVQANMNLVRGAELIKVAIVDRSERTDHGYKRTRNIEVYKAPSKFIKTRDFVGVSECRPIQRIEFWEIADNWFGTEDEYNARRAKHKERYYANPPKANRNENTEFPQTANAVVLPLVKRQRGFKRCTLENIEKVTKHIGYDYNGKLDEIAYYAHIRRDGKYECLRLYVKYCY